jgi:hypothetical protein
MTPVAVLVALARRPVEVEEDAIVAHLLGEPAAPAWAQHRGGDADEPERGRHGHVGLGLVEGLHDRRGDVFGLHRLLRSGGLGARDQFGVGERRQDDRHLDALRSEFVGEGGG